MHLKGLAKMVARQSFIVIKDIDPNIPCAFFRVLKPHAVTRSRGNGKRHVLTAIWHAMGFQETQV